MKAFCHSAKIEVLILAFTNLRQNKGQCLLCCARRFLSQQLQGRTRRISMTPKEAVQGTSRVKLLGWKLFKVNFHLVLVMANARKHSNWHKIGYTHIKYGWCNECKLIKFCNIGNQFLSCFYDGSTRKDISKFAIDLQHKDFVQ